MFVTRNVVSGRATVRGTCASIATLCPPLTIRVTARSGRSVPPFGNRVYADAISYGDASKTPSAMDG
jgi:hypothetical protein